MKYHIYKLERKSYFITPQYSRYGMQCFIKLINIIMGSCQKAEKIMNSALFSFGSSI